MASRCLSLYCGEKEQGESEGRESERGRGLKED